MCWYCGSPVSESEPIGRSLRCVVCGKDLRSCRNCKLFLPGGGCAEGQADCPQDKERAGFCDWFVLNPAFRVPTPGEEKARSKAQAAKSAFENLFS